MKHLNYLSAVVAILLGSVTLYNAMAHGEKGVDVNALLSELPSDLAGKRITMVEVTYPPGTAFQAHRHPGSVLVYVLAGEIQSQLDSDAAPITYKKGDVWYESPNARHVYSNNPSNAEAAILLAILIGNDGDELVLPDTDGH